MKRKPLVYKAILNAPNKHALSLHLSDFIKDRSLSLSICAPPMSSVAFGAASSQDEFPRLTSQSVCCPSPAERAAVNSSGPPAAAPGCSYMYSLDRRRLAKAVAARQEQLRSDKGAPCHYKTAPTTRALVAVQSRK